MGRGEDENKCVIQIMMTSENYSLQSSLTLFCSFRISFCVDRGAAVDTQNV